MTDGERLTRIENKIDNLERTMLDIVRMEERITTVFKRLEAHDDRLNEHGRRLSDVEKTSDRRGEILGRFERLFWIAITAGAGTAFTVLFLRGG